LKKEKENGNLNQISTDETVKSKVNQTIRPRSHFPAALASHLASD
jgi:hypothetical protein